MFTQTVKISLVIYIFFKWFYSPNINPINFVSALNHDCSICMNCSYEPRSFLTYRLSVAEDTFFPQQYFLTNFIIIVNSALVFMGIIKICQSLPTFSNLLPVSYEMSNNISRPNIAAPGETLSTVWQVERTAHAASNKKTSMSLAFTVSAILSSDVHNMFPSTA